MLDELRLPDVEEDNPVYNLEIRQVYRNFLFHGLLLCGFLAGMYLFLLFFDPAGHSGWAELTLPLSLYGLGITVIVLYTGGKLASQQVHEDQVLQTPLRSSTILWGKLQIAMTLSLCLFVPTYPGAVALCWQGSGSEGRAWLWLLHAAAGPLITVFLSMIALGFMACVKTPMTRGVAIFLGLVFGLGLAPVWIVLLVGYVGLLHASGPWEIVASLVGFALGLSLLGISSLFLYGVGLATLRRERDLMPVMVAVMIVALSLLPLPIFTVFFFSRGIDMPVLLGTSLLYACYFAAPLLALYMIHRHRRTPLYCPP